MIECRKIITWLFGIAEADSADMVDEEWMSIIRDDPKHAQHTKREIPPAPVQAAAAARNT